MKVISLVLFCNLFYFSFANSIELQIENEDLEDLLLGNNDESYNKINDSLEDDDIQVRANASFKSIFGVDKYVTLNLYRRSDPDYPFTLTQDNFANAPLDPNLRTEIIIHGWLNSADKLWVLRMKDKYLLNGDYNVIVIDWEHYANWEYTLATYKLKPIAEYITKVLTPMIENGQLDPENIHIVGHCLGAHIAGFIGKNVQKQLQKNIGRITGLDVARSLYEFPLLISKSKRLVKEDALFVDLIHACGGNYGFKSAIGHVDFYPNGGTARQPGCSLITPYLCSRARSYEYYTESINTKNFLATPCKSWKKFKKGQCDGAERIVMGLHIDTKSVVEGKFYLRTSKREPYSKG